MEIMGATMGLTTGSGVIMTTMAAVLIMTTTALTMDGATMTADLPTEITAQTTMAGEVTTDHQTIGEVDRLTIGETMETPPPTQTCNPPRLYNNLMKWTSRRSFGLSRPWMPTT